MREEIELFGGPEYLLGCRHKPPTPAAGVVICSSAPFDAAVDQGREARLGRRLARAGVAVQRFHYRGDPPSDGDPTALSFASLVDDARRALKLLRDRCRVERLGFVGARLGALVAARLAQAHDGAPLALWEPVIDPRSVIEQAARTRGSRPGARPTSRSHAGDHAGSRDAAGSATVPSTAGGTERGPATATGLALADDDRAIDLFDTPLAADLLDGALVGCLVDEMGGRPRSLLVVQTAPGDCLRPHYELLVARCCARHLVVDTACHPCDGERDGAPVPVAAGEGLVDQTAAWLVAHLVAPDDAAPPGHDARRAADQQAMP